MANQGIAIADLIVAVSDGIREAKEKSAGKEAVLALSECELELAATVTYDGKAGLKFWIIEVGGGAASENLSRVKLKFNAAGDSHFFAVTPDATAAALPPLQPRKSKAK